MTSAIANLPGRRHRRLAGRWRSIIDPYEAGFRELVERNFALRARVFPIGARDREMVSIARAYGAAAKLCGSGGAVVGVPEQEVQMDEIARAYARAGFETLRPRLAPRGGVSAGGAAA